ncbi:TniQ family protein [Burkholderia cepacia]|uniref:TnsD family Tn7-like transposition protein n=1 Tax=Burkholderia cepacia TaxID=292 RepID=UPI001C9899AF|nr:TniQ family protein [Burkholderia cepacia]MBY4803662.1 TniQ family protein [Burkholderia cepacia]
MYFPTLYPDELTGSLLIRASHHLGLTLRELIYLILGCHKGESRYSFLLPSILAGIAEYIGALPHDLLMRHTIYPYARISFDPQQNDRWENHYSTMAPANHINLLRSLYPPNSGLSQFRRYCEHCKIDELLRFGESYWHVSHTLPAVSICPTHHVALQVCPIRLLSSKISQSNFLPQEICVSEKAMLHASHSLLLEISMQSIHILKNSFDECLCERSQYFHLAEELGYDIHRRIIDRQRFIRDIKYYFGSQLLDELGAPIKWETDAAWPLILLNGDNSDSQAQLKRILLKIFLTNKKIINNREIKP